MNEREVFAFVLLNLVRGQCAANRSESVSRTGLQAQVPVKERAFARRGLSALVEHKALVMRGEQIGPTARGHLYLDEHVLKADERPTLEATQDPDLLSLRSAIRQDMRLSHDSIEAAQSLPGRLEEPQVNLPEQRRIPVWGIALTLVVVALVVFAMSRAIARAPALRTGVNGVTGSLLVSLSPNR